MARSATGTTRKLASGRWQVRLTYPDGVRRSAPQTFQAKRDATAWLTNELSDISRGTWKPQRHAGSVARSFGDYTERWLDRHRTKGRPLAVTTKEKYRDLIDRYLMPTFGSRPLHLITRIEVKDWHDSIESKPTRFKAFALLSGIMKEALDEGLIDASPVLFRDAQKYTRAHEPKPLSLAELAVLTENMPERWQALVQVAFWSGLRWGELTELRRKDIEFKGGDLAVLHVRRAVVHTKEHGATVKGTKNDKGRDVVLPAVAVPWLRSRLESGDVLAGPEALVWPSPSDSTKHVRQSAVHRPLSKARVLAGRPDFHFHDFRHTAGTMLAQQGATLAELMAHLGHTTVEASLIYQHAAKDRMDTLAALVSAQAEAYAQGVADAARLPVPDESRPVVSSPPEQAFNVGDGVLYRDEKRPRAVERVAFRPTLNAPEGEFVYTVRGLSCTAADLTLVARAEQVRRPALSAR